MPLKWQPRPYEPLRADHPLVGQKCPRCGSPFNAGDVTCLVDPVPSDGEQARRALAGLAYTATATPAHWSCVVEAQ